ncbi:hypothetical protein E2C01_006563 [Portunus trituberculatus]|uniref:Uncharacterized protein n=1 Tax=Portunus trituberculatus TaxID=210409 RepID=A0A5B7CZW2_PORTR|nr:hypothetical protein [Portunus trituberculatus]
MEEDSSENPLSSLQYHTLMVLGTEDYAAARTFQEPQLVPEGGDRDGQEAQGVYGKEDQQRSKNVMCNNLHHKEQTSSVSRNNMFDALRQNERQFGLECSESCAISPQNGNPASSFMVTCNQGFDIGKKSSGVPISSPPVSLEYCSSPVPRLIDPSSYDHVRPAAASCLYPPRGAVARGITTQAAHLTYSSAGVFLPSLTPQSSLSSRSHLEFSSPASWSSAGSSRTPCVSSISSTESVWPCRRDLMPHSLYSHDKVPLPIPVSGALGLHPARLRKARLAESTSSCSEKTLVGSEPDSARILGSGRNSESLSPDTADSNPVYENPSELDSEYYYKSPKGVTLLVEARLCSHVGDLQRPFTASALRSLVRQIQDFIERCWSFTNSPCQD